MRVNYAIVTLELRLLLARRLILHQCDVVIVPMGRYNDVILTGFWFRT